ncbi:alanine/glycine:cation symporter family protein [Bacillus solimangrovi]|uniref:Sodium:alanine symporter n=1 Tax=Bacillus solimangrovi TaxID=1305675 RepID=A0A1E5LJC6_9BACI|nr:alanine/glycine:cation symporter family protein [Bacillus solimangrovi]OEH94199.1 sodium:alanine symporter [Bacillus solimangrovi]
MDIITSIVGMLNDFIWSKLLIATLLALGLYFTLRTKLVQFRLIPEMFRLLKESPEHKSKDSISSFQAFSISTASRVGTGNMAGVATAIAGGGPGAVFWMWVIALIGGASSFVESTLAQIYKEKDEKGFFRGGPAYYIEKALNQRWLGIIFAILLIICYGFVFNALQANTITLAFNNSFEMSRGLLGIFLAIVTALVIFGGVKRIANFTQIVVPVMAIVYIVIAVIVIAMNFTLIPELIGTIVSSAFGFREVASGGVGAAIMLGIKRGLFSNEAGMGSVPNAAATADVSHPVKQGLIQTLGVFVDTIILCSATAFIILLAGNDTGDLTGIELLQESLNIHIGGWAGYLISFAILLFAFSSIIGNYYYGESNIQFINSNKGLMYFYRAVVISMVLWGSVVGIDIVWSLADLFMGLMALINLVVIAILGKFAFSALDDYLKQRKAGQNPTFHVDNIHGLENVECWGEKGSKKQESN